MSTAPVRRSKREWSEVIKALTAANLTIKDIAGATDRSQFTVYDWRRGAEPKESDARIMLALLAKHAPEEYRRLQGPYEIRLSIAMEVK